VVAGLADVAETEQRHVTDEQFEQLKEAFGLQFIEVDLILPRDKGMRTTIFNDQSELAAQ
jgi:hypothetical protein